MLNATLLLFDYLRDVTFMELKGKALYNLLKFSKVDSPTLEVKPWQIEDLSLLSTDSLFERLSAFGLPLTQKNFLLYADEADSPEELLECLWIEEEEGEKYQRVYLILFELWKRLLAEKQSLSILCDQLDHLIEQYDRSALIDLEPLHNAFSLLEDVVDDSCDQQNISPQEAFEEIQKYCAHDLESFIYDYCKMLIEQGEWITASELIDAFYDCIFDKKWFDFLRGRIFYATQNQEANKFIERLLEQLKEEPDIDLLLQIIDSLVHVGDLHLFRSAVKQAIGLLKTQADLQELLYLIADYYLCLDKETEEKKIRTLIDQRAHIPLDHPVYSTDPLFKQLDIL